MRCRQRREVREPLELLRGHKFLVTRRPPVTGVGLQVQSLAASPWRLCCEPSVRNSQHPHAEHVVLAVVVTRMVYKVDTDFTP